jgi:hypothetical protein
MPRHVCWPQLANIELHDIDGDLRMLDLDLGAMLGYAHPRNVRKAIIQHKTALNKNGEVWASQPKPSSVGGQGPLCGLSYRSRSAFVTAKKIVRRRSK